jgi:hypothetical protein
MEELYWKQEVEFMEPLGSKQDCATAFVSPRPFQRQDSGQERSAQPAREVILALAPVEARYTSRAFFHAGGIWIDPKVANEFFPHPA